MTDAREAAYEEWTDSGWDNFSPEQFESVRVINGPGGAGDIVAFVPLRLPGPVPAAVVQAAEDAALIASAPRLKAEVAQLRAARAALRPFAKEWADGGWGTDSDDEYPLIRGEDDDAGSEEHAHFSAGDLRRAFEAYGGDDALEGAADAQEVVQLRASRKRLRDDLKHFGRHLAHCASETMDYEDCDCGFDAALEGAANEAR